MQTIKPRDTQLEMSYRIVDAVADADSSDPLTMHPPLYDVINSEALDTVLDTDAPVKVEFEYQGHCVVVKSDGTVLVDGVVY